MALRKPLVACALAQHFLLFTSCCSCPLRVRSTGPTGAQGLHFTCLLSSSRTASRVAAAGGPSPSASARSSTQSSDGPSTLVARGGWGHGWPRAVLATACCTATDSLPHPRRVQPEAVGLLYKTAVEPGLLPNAVHRR